MATETLEREGFYMCCKADIISGFPKGDRALRSMVDNKAKVRKEVQRLMDNAWIGGKATVVAILTEKQTTAAKVLEEMGWYHSAPMKKYNNPGNSIYVSKSKLTLWWCQLDEYEWVNDI